MNILLLTFGYFIDICYHIWEFLFGDSGKT